MISSDIYPPEKQAANKKTVWEYYFARKIAFFLAPFFIKLRISANAVSFLSFVSGVLGAIFIAFGNFWLVLAGGILMQIWLVLDKTDGIVARMTKKSSKFGEFFEEVNGSLTAALFFTSIGFAASKFPGFFPNSVTFSSNIFALFGIFTSFFVVFRHLAARHFEAVFGNEKTSVFPSQGLFGSLYGFTVKFSGVYSLAQPIFILAAVFNFLGLYTLAYFIFQGFLMVAHVVSLTFKARGK
jgi:hypothetical protein